MELHLKESLVSLFFCSYTLWKIYSRKSLPLRSEIFLKIFHLLLERSKRSKRSWTIKKITEDNFSCWKIILCNLFYSINRVRFYSTTILYSGTDFSFAEIHAAHHQSQKLQPEFFTALRYTTWHFIFLWTPKHTKNPWQKYWFVVQYEWAKKFILL